MKRENMKGIVYGLVASDEPIHIRYIGETVNPRKRFMSYLRKCSNTSSHVRKWINSVQNRGASIQMVTLGEYQQHELDHAERAWIRFWKKYCELLNFDLMEGTIT